VPSPGVLRATAWTLPAAGGQSAVDQHADRVESFFSRCGYGSSAQRRKPPTPCLRRSLESDQAAWPNGQGTALMVRDLTTDSQAEWVLKQLRFDRRESRARREKRRARFAREIAALKRLQSSHIPPVLDTNEEEAFFVTPYVGKSFDRLPHVVARSAGSARTVPWGRCRGTRRALKRRSASGYQAQ
jgi:hypothetical protein